MEMADKDLMESHHQSALKYRGGNFKGVHKIEEKTLITFGNS
jgi:hypothetical protein